MCVCICVYFVYFLQSWHGIFNLVVPKTESFQMKIVVLFVPWRCFSTPQMTLKRNMQSRTTQQTFATPKIKMPLPNFFISEGHTTAFTDVVVVVNFMRQSYVSIAGDFISVGFTFFSQKDFGDLKCVLIVLIYLKIYIVISLN